MDAKILYRELRTRPMRAIASVLVGAPRYIAVSKGYYSIGLWCCAFVACVLLLGCRLNRFVKNETAAIRVASKACKDEWGGRMKKEGTPWRENMALWHATLEDGLWVATYGVAPLIGTTVRVRQDGTVLGGCAITVPD